MAELLLVDDDPDLAFIVKALARRAGHSTVCCPDVPSAWQQLRRARPDLLLLDINLPGVSGLHLCRRLRQVPALAETPVALFTQLALVEDIAAGLEAGADFLLAKDLVCRPSQWQQRLAEILERRGRLCGRRGGPSARASLEYQPEWRLSPLPDGWVLAVNRALAHPSVRVVGGAVLRVLLQRAVRECANLGEVAGALSWLDADGERFDPERAGRSLPGQLAAALLVALTEQLWCLLGSQGSAPWRAALLGLLPEGASDPGSLER
jgi:CheY-like chemotaxis protein